MPDNPTAYLSVEERERLEGSLGKDWAVVGKRLFAHAADMDKREAALIAERDQYRVWMNCGGAPSGRQCRIDGLDIYGGYLTNPEGLEPICELHGYRELLEQAIAERDRMREALEAEVKCPTCEGTGVMTVECGCVYDYADPKCPMCAGKGSFGDTCAECDGTRQSFRSELARDALAPTAPATPAEPNHIHMYMSTACVHQRHAECRLQCKFCEHPCACACHQATPAEKSK